MEKYNFEEIEQMLLECIRECKELCVDDEGIKKCSDLTELGFDSIELMYMVIYLEDKFNMTFEEQDLVYDNITCFKRLAEILYKQIEKKTKND